MFEKLELHGNRNERTGFGIHASRFYDALEKLCVEKGEGTVHISLLDVVTASQTDTRHPGTIYTVHGMGINRVSAGIHESVKTI